MSASNQKSGLAVTSLVLGILSVVCFGILAGIPAIILGHIAHSRSRHLPEQYGGGGMAIAGFALGYASFLATIVIAAMLLPALAKAKERAQEIRCANNMRQISVAFRIWEGDHEDHFPFSLSTNKGGTMEFCLLDGDGFDRNAVRHFQVLSNELLNPRLLLCPVDSAKQPATDFQSLQPDNVSYQIHSSTNASDSNPEEVLLQCPIHHTVLKYDGSVIINRPRRR